MMNLGSIKRYPPVYVLVTIMVWAVVMSCATWPVKSSKPDWIDGISSKYSSDHYVIGVGYGSERR